MTRTLRPAMTPARLAWLQRLEREAMVHPWRVAGTAPRGPVVNHCLSLGWSEWVCGLHSGVHFGIVLTDAGRAALYEHRDGVRF